MHTALRLMLLAAVAFFTACSTTVQKAVLVNRGDTTQQVLALMGPPDDRQFREKDEAWTYSASRFGYAEYRVVWFYDGRVTGVSSYRQSGRTADGGIRQINWESRPDTTIEVRSR